MQRPPPPQSAAAAAAAIQQQQLQQQQPAAAEEADCMACRVTGLMTCLGGAGYLSSRLLVPPAPSGRHRAALLAASAALVALGGWRAAG